MSVPYPVAFRAVVRHATGDDSLARALIAAVALTTTWEGRTPEEYQRLYGPNGSLSGGTTEIVRAGLRALLWISYQLDPAAEGGAPKEGTGTIMQPESEAGNRREAYDHVAVACLAAVDGWAGANIGDQVAAVRLAREVLSAVDLDYFCTIALDNQWLPRGLATGVGLPPSTEMTRGVCLAAAHCWRLGQTGAARSILENAGITEAELTQGQIDDYDANPCVAALRHWDTLSIQISVDYEHGSATDAWWDAARKALLEHRVPREILTPVGALLGRDDDTTVPPVQAATVAAWVESLPQGDLAPLTFCAI